MKNLKIGARLGIGFAIVLSLLLVLTVTALGRMQSAGDLTYRLVNTSIKNQRNVAEWAKLIELNSAMIETVFVASDPAIVRDVAERMKAASSRSNELQEAIEGSLRNEGVKAQFKVVKETRMTYLAAREALFKAKLEANDPLAVTIYRDRMKPATAAFTTAISKLATMQITAADGVATTILDSYASTRTLLIVLGLAAIGLGIACAILITRSITAPIHQAVALAEKVASGDLSSRIQATSRDETGQLMRALGAMNDSLAEIVGRVRSGTGTITVAAGEIAAGNQDLSARTEQQAGSLEETAASMEELTSTVKQNAENARQANTLAAQASSIADQGGAMVAEVVATMGSIDASSRKIVDIISVIDGIAFQTNILALNAAVEAARAGEQGRGFAVVASEVRNLAQRSATAAKEIKALIDDSVQKVQAGSSQVDRAGTTMTEIVRSIGQVTVIMNEIASASEEQRAGIEQVNHAIVEMDRVTQQNAALVEQASAAAQAMQDQAGELEQVVGTFKLAHGDVRGQDRHMTAPAGRLALS
ncbi:methyl-accepting chemotaxis protein [Herbaspirillum sp. SJZ107]|uniref:methyl-accepting chemotaxis protein n=1 Tax=Herbaspirillum sp. SJZ107 TaxID=2572881 RepID=UPI0011541326|nr:methyl-accepting chemotaxis protein [Herbaspirillum sp. SJZ107]TQK05569.1 methyl-accepting chemotaxis protein [Herbaspirillum sp. SJZ107]